MRSGSPDPLRTFISRAKADMEAFTQVLNAAESCAIAGIDTLALMTIAALSDKMQAFALELEKRTSVLDSPPKTDKK